MNEWQVDIETDSRADVLKICTIFAKAIGRNAILNKRLNIFINGSVNCGKSAISDGLTAAFSDEHNSYYLDTKSLIEKSYGEAWRKGSLITLPANGKDTIFTLQHFITELDIEEGAHHIGDDIKYDSGGIDFTTVCGSDLSERGDISMCFRHNLFSTHSEWSRKMSMIVHNPELQTIEVQGALNHLRSFHRRRQARRQLEQDTNIQSPA